MRWILGVALVAAGACNGGALSGASDSGEPGADGGRDVASSKDGADCLDSWRHPAVEVMAGRPSSSAMTLTFKYEAQADGGGKITLERAVEASIAQRSDGPFSLAVNSGTWVEVQNAEGKALYTRGVYQLIPTSLEAFGPAPGDIHQLASCPTSGIIDLSNLANPTQAAFVAFYQTDLAAAAALATFSIE